MICTRTSVMPVLLGCRTVSSQGFQICNRLEIHPFKLYKNEKSEENIAHTRDGHLPKDELLPSDIATLVLPSLGKTLKRIPLSQYFEFKLCTIIC